MKNNIRINRGIVALRSIDFFFAPGFWHQLVERLNVSKRHKNISNSCFRFNWTKELKVVSTWRLRMQVASGDKLWNYFIVVALEAFKVCYLLSFVNLFFCYQKIILLCCISMTIPLIFARLQTINYLRTIVSDWITNLSVSSQCFYHASWS